MTPEEMYAVIIKHERRSEEELPELIWDIIQNNLGRRKSPLAIQNVDPVDDVTEVSGQVMEQNNPINIFKRLGYNPDNPISVKLLGSIGKVSWAYMRVRSRADKRNHCLEFDLFVRTSLLRLHPVRKGQTILGMATRLSHPKGSIWELSSYNTY
jgi:hypothetical protein